MWPNPQETADLVTFTGEILNGKLHFFVQWSIFLLSTRPKLEVCKMAVGKELPMFPWVINQNKTQKVCERSIEDDIEILYFVPAQYKTQEMYNSTAEEDK